MTVTLINAFVIPKGQEEEFLKNWQETAEVFSHRHGFIETHLHRNTGIGDGTFQFVNIARWESSEAWQSAIQERSLVKHDPPGVKAYPALYESMISFQHQGE